MGNTGCICKKDEQGDVSNLELNNNVNPTVKNASRPENAEKAEPYVKAERQPNVTLIYNEFIRIVIYLSD